MIERLSFGAMADAVGALLKSTTQREMEKGMRAAEASQIRADVQRAARALRLLSGKEDQIRAMLEGTKV